jgi:recombination protein RecT
MSNIQRYENLKQIVVKVQPTFEELARIHGAVDYKREASFALQCLENNDFLAGVAMADQDSLKNAVINVAAIGLSLSPVHKLAYLVPRNKKVCLDISYQGLVQLAIDTGAILWVHADLVYQKDKFILNGLGKEPTHTFEPFDTERGEFVGGYCTSKTASGEFITITMNKELIFKIRGRSEAFKRNSGPWVTDFEEMAKKTLIKRGYKSWPKKSANDNERLAKAMAIEEDSEPIEVESQPVNNSEYTLKIELVRESLAALNKTEDAYIKHLTTTCRREIKKLDDLTDIELDQSVVLLNQMVEKLRFKPMTEETKTEVKVEEKQENPNQAAMDELNRKLGLK